MNARVEEALNAQIAKEASLRLQPGLNPQRIHTEKSLKYLGIRVVMMSK